MKVFFLIFSLFLSLPVFAGIPDDHSVGTKQLKNNAVRTKQVKNDSLTADDVKELTNIARADLTNGQQVDIFDDGIIRLQARCEINVVGEDIVKVLVFSTEEHTSFDSDNELADLLTSTIDDDRTINEYSVTTGETFADQESDGMIQTPSGRVYVLNLGVGLNLFSQIGHCTVGGYINEISGL
jgi:hypothetical protein